LLALFALSRYFLDVEADDLGGGTVGRAEESEAW